MATKTAARNVYDPRVRELIRATGDPDLFPELGIPRSTATGWLRGDFKPAVGAEAVSRTEIELHARLAKLDRRIRILVAVVRLLLALVRVSGCRLNGERLPTGKAKADILAEAAKYLPTPAPAVAVITDSGGENVNSTVDEALGDGPLQRVLAQIDIVESNSLLQVWWLSLRHQWLYLNTLDTAAAVRRLVAF
jgi:hypothetical protein